MTPLFARLEFIDDLEPHDAAFNMAADEALLEGLAEQALLRIYRWRRPAVSFGYFDHVAPVTLGYPGRDLVRRWTGGGVVEHGEDFTYSLLVPRSHALTAARAEESYRVLHEVVARALSSVGATPPLLQEARPTAGIVARSRACFVHAVQHDLLLGGRKIAGAAQRRTRRGWLHQGSIRLADEAQVIDERLRGTLPMALSAEVRLRPMRPAEVTHAQALALEKYGTEAWLRRV